MISDSISWQPVNRRQDGSVTYRGYLLQKRYRSGYGREAGLEYYLYGRRRVTSIASTLIGLEEDALIIATIHKTLLRERWLRYAFQLKGYDFGLIPMDGIPWEIHAISNLTAYTAAAREFLRERERD